jgi:hypothetical protein
MNKQTKESMIQAEGPTWAKSGSMEKDVQSWGTVHSSVWLQQRHPLWGVGDVSTELSDYATTGAKQHVKECNTESLNLQLPWETALLLVPSYKQDQGSSLSAQWRTKR